MSAYRLFTALILALAACAAQAEDVILSADAFLARHFGAQIPAAAAVWLTGDRGARAADILGHTPASLRVRYFRDGPRTAWILDEIGKERPITAGFVVADGRLQAAEVLIYREHRGGEIRSRSFLNQFIGRILNDNGLDGRIDNITGATLSVRAMSRMAALALYLDQSLGTS